MSPSETKNKCRKNVTVFVQFGVFLKLSKRYKRNVPYILDLLRRYCAHLFHFLRPVNYFAENTGNFPRLANAFLINVTET